MCIDAAIKKLDDKIVTVKNSLHADAYQQTILVVLCYMKEILLELKEPEQDKCEHELQMHQDTSLPMTIKYWYICKKCGVTSRSDHIPDATEMVTIPRTIAEEVIRMQYKLPNELYDAIKKGLKNASTES